GSYPYRGEDLVLDGSFSRAGDTINTIYSAGNVIGGAAGSWVVNTGDVEVVATLDTAPSGGPFLDMVGTTTGTITQSIATEPGKTYVLKFAMSGDFQSIDQHQFRVTVDDGIQMHADITANKPDNWALNNIIWDQHSVSFTPTSINTSISFTALTNVGNGGAFVTDVSVVEVDPAIAAVMVANPGTTYNAGTQKFYQTDSRELNWHTAQSNAVANQLNGVSGRLVTVHSSYENSVVQNLASAMGKNTYLGLSDQTTEGEWYWQTGSGDGALAWSGNAGGSAPDGVYTNWNGSEPNNHGGVEDHAGMFEVSGV
ncbi:MAG: lectin-like protein, partial [Pseudomonadota bacterium]